MRIHDVSVPIRAGMPIYDGNPGVELERASSIAAGEPANVSRLTLGVHTGTHVDAPLHFLEGAAGAEGIPLEAVFGPAVVVDATGVVADALGEAELEGLGIPEGAERVLLKTRNSELWARADFTRDFIRLDGSGARFVVARGIRTIGIDYLSVGDGEAHRVLLEAGVVPVEGLDLREIDPGEYTFACLPLDVVGSDGAPARAVLISA
ncbi:MAG TPA: cyclase family protein [Gaiellaceae bacterium]|nr:cyclase family protein [Gaiellaceae bacterium]